MPVFEKRDMDQPQFCYVLTTTGRDVFGDMTYASVQFLRYAHPEAQIICLCDAQSHRALESMRHPLLEAVDRAEPVVTPDGSAGHRNRFIKTQMRQIVQGDFVYFDSDTVVVDRVDEMFACPAPMAGIPNFSGTGDPSEICAKERDVFAIMGWPLPRRPFINGGVLLLRDCEPTHNFARLWHDKWRAWSSRGRHADQQSLNSALAESGIDYAVLGNRFNGQVNQRPSLCLEPIAVWHYYSSQNGVPGLVIPRTILHEAIARFRAKGRLTPDMIREMRQWPYPWYTPTALDRWYVKRFVWCKNDIGFESSSRYWLAGHRRQALMKYLRWRLFEQPSEKRIRRAIAEAMEQKSEVAGSDCTDELASTQPPPSAPGRVTSLSPLSSAGVG